jgi:hypothetical protein
MKTLAWGLVLVLLVAFPSYGLSVDAVGHIHTLKGTASVTRGTIILPAAVGAPLSRGDIVRTGNPGSVGIVLTDDTTISLGPNSELSLDEYAFNPKEGRFSLVLRMVKGTFAYLSGLIAKLAPDAAQLAIPEATIAVRGTKVLVHVEE